MSSHRYVTCGADQIAARYTCTYLGGREGLSEFGNVTMFKARGVWGHNIVYRTSFWSVWLTEEDSGNQRHIQCPGGTAVQGLSVLGYASGEACISTCSGQSGQQPKLWNHRP